MTGKNGAFGTRDTSFFPALWHFACGKPTNPGRLS